MIYPTRFAVLLLVPPEPRWGCLLALERGRAVDGGSGLDRRGGVSDAEADADRPRRAARSRSISSPGLGGLFIGRRGEVRIDAGFRRPATPRSVDIAVETNESSPCRLTAAGRLWSRAAARRRASRSSPAPGHGAALTGVWHAAGADRSASVWLRQTTLRPGRNIPVVPNIDGVRDEAIRLFSRQASFGIKVQRESGEGSEFHALRDFPAGHGYAHRRLGTVGPPLHGCWPRSIAPSATTTSSLPSIAAAR